MCLLTYAIIESGELGEAAISSMDSRLKDSFSGTEVIAQSPIDDKRYKYIEFVFDTDKKLRVGLFDDISQPVDLYFEVCDARNKVITNTLSQIFFGIYENSKTESQKRSDNSLRFIIKTLELATVLIVIATAVWIMFQIYWNFDGVQKLFSSDPVFIANSDSKSVFSLGIFFISLFLFLLLAIFIKPILSIFFSYKFWARAGAVRELDSPMKSIVAGFIDTWWLWIIGAIIVTPLLYLPLHAKTAFGQDSLSTRKIFSLEEVMVNYSDIKVAKFGLFKFVNDNGKSIVTVEYTLETKNKEVITIIDGGLVDLPDNKSVLASLRLLHDKGVDVQVGIPDTSLYAAMDDYNASLKKQAKELLDEIAKESKN